MRLFSLLCFVSSILLACSALPPGVASGDVVSQWKNMALQGTTVAPQGVTEIEAVFDKTRISVKITAHEVDIGGVGVVPPEKNLSGCTYSRIPCSLVDYLEISINGRALFVARSVYADRADLGKATIRQSREGEFELILIGGDASESYTVCVAFDENRVKQKTVAANEAGQVASQTTYFELDPLDY
jgi:hypothetical protein